MLFHRMRRDSYHSPWFDCCLHLHLCGCWVAPPWGTAEYSGSLCVHLKVPPHVEGITWPCCWGLQLHSALATHFYGWFTTVIKPANQTNRSQVEFQLNRSRLRRATVIMDTLSIKRIPEVYHYAEEHHSLKNYLPSGKIIRTSMSQLCCQWYWHTLYCLSQIKGNKVKVAIKALCQMYKITWWTLLID